MNKLKNLILAARGEKKADLVFKNANVLNVFTKEYITCDLAIKDGIIAGLGNYNGEREIDASGKFIIPGMIDSHVHIESSYLTPRRYAEAVLPFGITGIIADPHEIANVCGEAGCRFMMNSAKGLPFDIHYMLPSCVPATPFDHAGCTLTAKDTAELIGKYPFLGLGEMMNYPGLLCLDDDVLGKLKTADIIDGHAPDISGKDLCAYIASGVSTDHECAGVAEALEKVRLGMYVHLRQGTLAKNVADMAAAITPDTVDRFTLCTDDKHIDEILKIGSINDAVQAAVKAGIRPEYAITMASKNVADCYGLKGVGAIAPGFSADIVLCEDNAAQRILSVYKMGELVAENGKPTFESANTPMEEVCDTVHIRPLKLGDLVEEFDSKKPVIKTLPGSLYTEKAYASAPDGLTLAAVIERHTASGQIGRARIMGISIRGGAIAQTIGHDSHNIIVAGDNEADMISAVEALGKSGGIAVVKGGEVTAKLELPVAGLMTDIPAQKVADAVGSLVTAAEALCGKDGGKVLMNLAFLPLLVIPELKLSDSGLFDVNSFCFLEK